MAQPLQSRKYYLDFLRILACFLVCYNHSYGFELFLTNWDEFNLMYWADTFLSAFTTINIPLFLMISGALLLGKEESYKDLFQKRIVRLISLLVIFSFILYLIRMDQNKSGSLIDFLYSFLSGDINVSYWYLYAYLSYLLALPFLRKLARNICFRDVIFLFGLRFFFVTLSFILNLTLQCLGFAPVKLSSHLSAPIATLEYLLYPLVGYFLAEKLPMEKISKKHLAACVAVLIAGCALASFASYIEHRYFSATQDYIGLSNYTSAASVFILVRYFFHNFTISDKLTFLLRSVSSVTFGIYLLEPIVHLLHAPFFSLVYWHPALITVFSFIWAIVCMVIGGTATWFLHKVPGIKKVL